MTGQTDLAAAYSVVIPAFNAARTISESIQSLREQLVPPVRIIVIDDGSTDATAAIAESCGADVIRQANAGPGAASNAGIAQVSTEFLAFLDADDLWLPHKADHQLRLLRDRTDLSGIFGQARLFRHDDHDVATRASDPAAPIQDLWTRSSLMMRHRAAKRIGPLHDPPRGRVGELVDWISRGRDLGLIFEMVPTVVALRRVIAGSLSRRSNHQELGYLDVARRALERRRAAAQVRSDHDAGDHDAGNGAGR